MGYELNLQTNNKTSTTSPDIFVSKQKNNQISPDIFVSKQKNNIVSTNDSNIFESKNHKKLINNNTMPLLLVRLFIKVMFIHLLLTSDKYKTIFDTNIKKFYVLITLFISYIQILFVLYLLIKFKKYILKRIKTIFTKSCFIILLFLYGVYIISTLQLTYILINIDEYKCKDITFLTYYYNLMQIATILVSSSHFF